MAAAMPNWTERRSPKSRSQRKPRRATAATTAPDWTERRSPNPRQNCVPRRCSAQKKKSGGDCSLRSVFCLSFLLELGFVLG
jgi:hypothetical protein